MNQSGELRAKPRVSPSRVRVDCNGAKGSLRSYEVHIISIRG